MVDFGKLNEETKRRARLAKLIGMLGSDHDGEVLNAARFIRKMAEDEKKTLAELLLTGTERVVERVVYRDRPSGYQNPATRPYEPNRGEDYRNYDYNPYEKPRYRKTADDLDDRAVLNALKEILDSKDMDCLDFHMQEFVQSVPFQYDYDWQLSTQQKKMARVIIRQWRRRDAEPLI